MGVLKEIYDVIQKMRAAGKNENEISDIIAEASKKATVKKPEIGEIQKIETVKSQKTLKEGLSERGISTEDAARAFERINQASERKIRETTNNWHKMHGLPMRRRKRNGRRRKADGYSKDEDVS
jgi:SOS response regulatory protein OraA/RecX